MLALQCGMVTPRSYATVPASWASCSAPFLDSRFTQWGLKTDPCGAASSPLVLRAPCLARPRSPAEGPHLFTASQHSVCARAWGPRPTHSHC